MKRYVWDTNTFSDLVKGLEATRLRYRQVMPDQVVISAITEAEVRYGLARKPEATRYAAVVHELLKTITIVPWSSSLAFFYAKLRTEATLAGVVAGAHDLLIATHAYARRRILVTSDKGLSRLERWIEIENWRL